MYKFSERSLDRLYTCHPKLQQLFNEVIKYRDCTILCGHRTEAEQNRAFKEGKSKVQYPNSKHNTDPSRAIDVVPYPFPGWSNIAKFSEFAGYVKRIAEELGIKIEWGGDFRSFYDGPHFQLRDDEE